MTTPGPQPKKHSADTILFNGFIYTAEQDHPSAEAVAIRDGKIMALGTSEEVRKLGGEETQSIDLQGCMVMPGLIDGHCHSTKGAIANLFSCKFAFSATEEDIARILKDYVEKNPDAEWIIGGRWDSSFFENNDIPSPRTWLDSYSRDNAVYLRDITGHNGWANTKALQLLGLAKDTKDPKAHEASGRSDLRHELAHAGFIAPADIPRFKRLNAVADLSPYVWFPSPIIQSVLDALGERGEQYWPIRDLLEAGAPVLTGSDWPAAVPSMDPWIGIEAMVTRRDPSGQTPGALWPEQAISLKQTLRIFTIEGAKALRLEAETGSIKVGKCADLIVLGQNLFGINPDDIADTTVEMTLFASKVVHQKRRFYQWQTDSKANG